MSDVFVSYSHVDSIVANQIADVLTRAAVDYFRDVKDMDWGDRIETGVQTALEDANALLVVVSPASLKSAWVPYEIGYFSALKRRILPFLVHPSLDVPTYLSALKHASSIEEVERYFIRLKAEKPEPRTPTTAALPDLRVRYSAAVARSDSGQFTSVLALSAENHDSKTVFLNNFSIILDNGMRMQVIRDGLTGQPMSPQPLQPGQRVNIRLTRREFSDYQPENIIGLIVIDDIGRTFTADPNQLQACVAELFKD